MHENSQKFEKLRAKLLATAHGYSMVKFACLNDTFSEFLNWKQAQQKVNHCSKRRERKKKEKRKKIKYTKSLKMQVTFSKAFDFCPWLSENIVKCGASGKKGIYRHVANAFLSTLELIWPISRLKISRMSKKMRFWLKAPEVNVLNKAQHKDPKAC